MKALFLHVNAYHTTVLRPSERIGACSPEALRFEDDDDTGEGPPKPSHSRHVVERMEEGLLVLFQVEEHDQSRQIGRFRKDVERIARKVGAVRVMIGAFAHLSHSRPDPSVAKEIALLVVANCKAIEGLEVESSHFGYDKATILDIKGHPDAVKHRSY